MPPDLGFRMGSRKSIMHPPHRSHDVDANRQQRLRQPGPCVPASAVRSACRRSSAAGHRRRRTFDQESRQYLVAAILRPGNVPATTGDSENRLKELHHALAFDHQLHALLG